MEEPTCEIHAFSYSSAISNEAIQENPMYAMQESVSFGRFTSESLSWEKWSTFNRNRHVEEAEKYSKPGSVKQKKAYLEAHFKRMATLKGDSDSPDQTDTIQEALTEPNVDETVIMPTNNHIELHSQQLPTINDQQWIEKEPEIPGSGGNQNEDKLNNGEAQSSSIIIVGSDEPVRIQTTADLIDVEKQNPGVESESGLTETEEISLQSSNINQGNSAPVLIKRNPPLSSYIPSIEAEASPISSSSSAKSAVQPPAVDPVTDMVKKSRMDDRDKKRAPFYSLINRKLGRLVSPVIKKIGISSKASTKSRLRTTSKEKPKDGLCQSFCFGSKLQSNSLESPTREG